MQLSMHGCLNCTEHLSLDIALLNSSLTVIDCLHELGLAIVTHKWWFLWRWKWVLVARLRLTRLTLAFVIEVVAEPRYSFPLKYWNTNAGKKIQLEVYHVRRTLKFLWNKNVFQNVFTLGLQSFFSSKCCLEYVVYLVKEVVSFWGVGQLIGVAWKLIERAYILELYRPAGRKLLVALCRNWN